MEECPGRPFKPCAVRRELYAEMADETGFGGLGDNGGAGGTGFQKRSNGVNGVNGVGIGC